MSNLPPQQNNTATWSDMLQLHDKVARSKEDLEKHLGKERQLKYKEELDHFLQNQTNEKEEQRKIDEMLREKYKREFEEFKEKERLNKWNLRQVVSTMAEQSKKDSQGKIEKEKHQKEVEAQMMQQKFQEAAEIEKHTKLNQKVQKIALSQDLQRTYQQDHQFKIMDGQKAKELDKYYSESYTQLLNSQEANRRQFFDKLRQGKGNQDVYQNFARVQQEENRKKYEIDRNIIEKGQVEKSRKEDEIQRQKFLHKEQMTSTTVDILKQQMEFRKESEKSKKEQEIQEYNQQLLKSKQEFEYAQQLHHQQQEMIKQQTRDTLIKQMEEQRQNRRKENLLTPVEERLNRNDVNVIKTGADPLTQVGAPSIIPGRNLHYEWQLQNHYINKALNTHGDVEPHPSKAGGPGNGNQLHYSDQANYPQQQQPKKENPFDMLRASGNPTPDTLPKKHYNPITGDQAYNPGPINVSQTPNLYSIKNRINTQSVTNLHNPDWKKDYLLIKNKNGPHSNPLNIITNEYKPKH